MRLVRNEAKRIPIILFASGRGSNFDAIQKAIQNDQLGAEIRAVVSDQPDAAVLSKAEAQGIKTFLIPYSGFASRWEHEQKILSVISDLNPRFLVMAGYQRILTSRLIEVFRSERGYARVVNIHPSLLPAFPGLRAYAKAYAYGTQVSGVTVHLVEAEVDQGPICAQEAFSLFDCQTDREVEQRGLGIEHRLYPETLSWVLPEKFSVEYRQGGRICVRQN
jgi:phosphoribosylglycinamide formyltransferase-1